MGVVQQHGIDVSTAVARDEKIPMHRIISLKDFVIKAFDVESTSVSTTFTEL